jgi:hypothetical protein
MNRPHLRPCPGCSRHVRVSEGACPFCGGALDASFRAAPAPVPPSRRLSRAALVAFGTGALVLTPAALVIDCGGSSAAAYGGLPYESPPEDASEPVKDSALGAADVQVGSADAADSSVADVGAEASEAVADGEPSDGGTN